MARVILLSSHENETERLLPLCQALSRQHKASLIETWRKTPSWRTARFFGPRSEAFVSMLAILLHLPRIVVLTYISKRSPLAKLLIYFKPFFKFKVLFVPHGVSSLYDPATYGSAEVSGKGISPVADLYLLANENEQRWGVGKLIPHPERIRIAGDPKISPSYLASWKKNCEREQRPVVAVFMSNLGVHGLNPEKRGLILQGLMKSVRSLFPKHAIHFKPHPRHRLLPNELPADCDVKVMPPTVNSAALIAEAEYVITTPSSTIYEAAGLAKKIIVVEIDHFLKGKDYVKTYTDTDRLVAVSLDKLGEIDPTQIVPFDDEAWLRRHAKGGVEDPLTLYLSLIDSLL